MGQEARPESSYPYGTDGTAPAPSRQADSLGARRTTAVVRSEGTVLPEAAPPAPQHTPVHAPQPMGVDPLAENQPLGNLKLDYLVKHWAPAVRAFFVGLARNGFSATPEEIPLSGFIGFLRFYTLMRRDSWAFSYMPMDGGTSLAEPLADRAIDCGAEIRMGCHTTKVERTSTGWKIDYTQDKGNSKSKGSQRHLNKTDCLGLNIFIRFSLYE